MSILHDFTKPEYFEALSTSVGYGLKIVLGMLVVGAVLVVLGGGLNSKSKKDAAHH